MNLLSSVSSLHPRSNGYLDLSHAFPLSRLSRALSIMADSDCCFGPWCLIYSAFGWMIFILFIPPHSSHPLNSTTLNTPPSTSTRERDRALKKTGIQLCHVAFRTPIGLGTFYCLQLPINSCLRSFTLLGLIILSRLPLFPGKLFANYLIRNVAVHGPLEVLPGVAGTSRISLQRLPPFQGASSKGPSFSNENRGRFCFLGNSSECRIFQKGFEPLVDIVALLCILTQCIESSRS